MANRPLLDAPSRLLSRPGLELASLFNMLTGARILIADDDPQLLEALAVLLQQSGATVVRAHTGAELIDRLAEAGRFDLVVTDIAMPWMTGLSSMRAARTAGLGMPVIVITALHDSAIPAEVTALGRNAVLLHKPFETWELESAIERLLGNDVTHPSDPPNITA